ncbi:Fatty acyl-coa reductase [Thalictrum thalictroides]|uniref:Fatty acyl-CoA reductase n=1 Tax=Thalictrum thalictroides TaxID=46969 RepID=A0A7J6XCH5_THATH|nr:Fatty acyl-coa reductase [Thalictrum thalictroides]
MEALRDAWVFTQCTANLRTSTPHRPVSASRGRPGAPSARSSSVEPVASTGRPRRQSCSPSRGRAPNGCIHSSGSYVPAVSRARANGSENVSPVQIASKMVERVVNMRKLVPPKQDVKRSLQNNLTGQSSSPDSSGSGRTLSEKSLDMALRHMIPVDMVVNAIIVAMVTHANQSSEYDVALEVNTFGCKNVIDFAEKCVKLEMLLHVSTAYVCGEKPGLILEKPLKMGESLNGKLGLNIQQEKMLLIDTLNELDTLKATKEEKRLTMKELGMKRARLYGWPNTYVFTKAMGEMIMGHSRGKLPVVVVRPTVVTCTYKEPFPGWIEGTRHIDTIAVGYGKGKLTCFLADPTLVLDVVSF